ncbi:unnamed protein product, partial [Rotaria sordida]
MIGPIHAIVCLILNEFLKAE